MNRSGAAGRGRGRASRRRRDSEGGAAQRGLGVALALSLALSSAPALAVTEVVQGNSAAGPLSAHIYAFVQPEDGDILPVGEAIWYLFALFDTAAPSVTVDTIFDADFIGFYDAAVDPDKLDVRIWGLDAVDPVTGFAPIFDPEAEAGNLGVGFSPEFVPTTIGGAMVNQVLAYIDYTTEVTRLFDFGIQVFPSTRFYMPGDPDIPTPAIWTELEAFGPTDRVDGVSRGQLYTFQALTFENGENTASSGDYDFLLATGDQTTMVEESVAVALGVDLGAVDDTLCVGGSDEQCTGGEVLNGYRIDRVEMAAPAGPSAPNAAPASTPDAYVIEDALVFVKPDPGFEGDEDGRIGTNFFEQTAILMDGPGARLGLPEPAAGLGSVSAMLCLALLGGRSRRRGARDL